MYLWEVPSCSEGIFYMCRLGCGVPCPPFSIAGKQLGKDDERDLFPEALRLIEECQPQAVLLENVRGFLSKKFHKLPKQAKEIVGPKENPEG